MAPGDVAARRLIDPSPGRLLALAAPMMIAHVTQPLLGLVDTAVIGRLGEVHLLGAVAVGAIVFDLLFWGLGSLRMSTAAFTAQAVGAGRDDEVTLTLMRAILMALAIGSLLVILQSPITALSLHLMETSPAVGEGVRTYIGVRIWAAPFTLVNYVVLGSLIGRARTDLGLGLQVFINVVNIALTLALVEGVGLGLAGAAGGTLAAEMVGAVAGVVLLRKLGWRRRDAPPSSILEPAALRRMFAVNRDVAIRSFALVAAFAFFTAQGSRSGDVTLAANAVLYNLFLFGSYALDSYATAAEQLCGQAVGSRDEMGFRRTVRNALALSIVSGLAVSALAWAGGTSFVGFVTTNPAVATAAIAMLPFAAATPAVGAAAFAYDGIYVGATWTRAMRDLMLLSLGLYLSTWWITATWGASGLWTAFLVFLGSRGLGQALAYPHLAARTFSPQLPG